MKCIKAAKRPHPQAVEVEPGVWAVPRDAAVLGTAALATDIAERTDLAGVLNRKRLVRRVPSGWHDATIDASGNLVPVDLKTGEVVVADVAVERVIR